MLYDLIIMGGGIVALATGYKFIRTRPDLKIAVLEKESQFHRTSRIFFMICKRQPNSTGSDTESTSRISIP